VRCRARTEGYIGARGLGGGQWEAITRIAVREPSDASERTADARGGRAARGRLPEAAGGDFASENPRQAGVPGSVTCPSAWDRVSVSSRFGSRDLPSRWSETDSSQVR